MQPEKIVFQAEMLANRLRSRFKHLKKWAHRIDTDAFRLYDRDIPEVPLVLDYYAGAIAGAFYERPYETDEKEESVWRAAMKKAISGAMQIDESEIFLKIRSKKRGNEQYTRFSGTEQVRTVHESGLLFQVNISDYVDTGLFLDRRNLRALVRSESAGKRILNLFCYTASFSIAAAAGNASAVHSVDLSNAYLEWAGDNFLLNHFSAEKVSFPDFSANSRCPFQLIRADVRQFLASALGKHTQWDLIILDPPTFSNSKKMAVPLDIARDYPELINRCIKLLHPDGTIYFSTNARHFHFDPSLCPGITVQDLRESLRTEDFRGKIPYSYKITHSPSESLLNR
ncbi:rRNA (guanine-N2)-methyltransferase [Spirochaetia bacterium]|nr:rRNA (guanine-N2)-methyltransferase [Spirochaetia bacterium]